MEHIWFDHKSYKVLDRMILPEVGECYLTESGWIRRCEARVMNTNPVKWWDEIK